MNLTPWRKPKYAPRPRAMCSSCGLTVAIASRITGEELMEMIRRGERIPVRPHACSFELEDTVHLVRDPDATVVVRATARLPRDYLRRN